MSHDLYVNYLLEKLHGLQESYKLYQGLIEDAEKRGDKEAKAKYEEALSGVRNGIQTWVDNNFGA